VVSGSIDDPAYVDTAVAGADIVLHTAGIFDLCLEPSSYLSAFLTDRG